MRYSILILFSITFFSLGCKKKEEEVIIPKPEISIDLNKTIVEGDDQQKTVTLKLYLSQEVPEGATPTISYYTEHVSADGDDYNSISEDDAQIVNFSVGERTKNITITINGDEEFESDEEFIVKLTSANGFRLKSDAKEAVVKITNDEICEGNCEGYLSPENYAGYELVWSDEFSEVNIDTDKWQWEVNGDGGGNGEEQYYTDRDINSYIEDGKLVLFAQREQYQDHEYTSARLNSSGKFSFQYGRIDFRAKVASGTGAWPALWMLGDNFWDEGWPYCGEIDIMEHVGYDAQGLHVNAYFGDQSGGKGDHHGYHRINEPWSDRYHIYSIEWNENGISYLVDNNEVHSLDHSNVGNYTYPFDQSFFIIMNIALGGGFGGTINDNLQNTTMKVDYVRVFQ